MTWPALADLAALTASTVALSMMVTALLFGVSTLLHRLLRGAVPQRLVWGVALGTSAVLTATQPWRRAVEREPMVMPVGASSPLETQAVPRAATTAERVFTLAAVAGERVAALGRVVPTVAGATARAAPSAVQWSIVLVWPIASLLLVVVGAWSYRRQRRAVTTASLATIDGHRVHVTPVLGPAVFGVLRPRVVVPEWLFTRSADEQRLVVHHEQAHIDARDPLLLMSACVVVALMPWNVGAWMLLSRLRLAIEVDCDARVLQRGAAPRHYGALLIDLSAAANPLPPLTGAPAFSHRASHLERRLRLMTDRPTSHLRSRRLAGLAIFSLALAAACGTELPTSAELEGMDVAAATKTLNAVAPSAKRQFYIDGRTATEAEALAISADRLASIEVTKAAGGAQAIRLTTRASASAAATSGAPSSPVAVAAITSDSTSRNDATVVAMRITHIDSTSRALRIADSAAKLSFSVSGAPLAGDSSRAFSIGDRVTFVPAKKTPDVLIFVDGVKATEEAMKMSPDRIERIEVIKGAAAEKLYGPEGAKGVIRITTKK